MKAWVADMLDKGYDHLLLESQISEYAEKDEWQRNWYPLLDYYLDRFTACYAAKAYPETNF